MQNEHFVANATPTYSMMKPIGKPENYEHLEGFGGGITAEGARD